jgi:retron-type reverse transcriptase
MATEITWIGEKARADKRCKFTALYHHVYDEDNLFECYRKLKTNSATGVDSMPKRAYGEELGVRLGDLNDRLRWLGYRPQPARRTYIPKVGSTKKRPLGIPCIEDKLVQLGMKRTMEQIYEADFLPCSYGYRPGVSQHDALRDLGITIQQKKVSYIVEADIKGFFDHVNHEWLMKFLEHRIQDKRILRLTGRNAKGGGQPSTFDFLGFTHYCGKTRYGVFKVKRKTSRKKYTAKLKETNKWMRKERSHLTKGELFQKTIAKMKGHINYYGITDNIYSCSSYGYHLRRILFKWLNRQSQRRSYTWEQYVNALEWWGWPKVRIVHNLCPFQRPALK